MGVFQCGVRTIETMDILCSYSDGRSIFANASSKNYDNILISSYCKNQTHTNQRNQFNVRIRSRELKWRNILIKKQSILFWSSQSGGRTVNKFNCIDDTEWGGWMRVLCSSQIHSESRKIQFSDFADERRIERKRDSHLSSLREVKSGIEHIQSIHSHIKVNKPQR